MPFGACSSTASSLSSWASKLLSIQACCSMAGCTLPGIVHLSQACQDTKVLIQGSWIRVTEAWVQGCGASAAAAAATQSTSLLQLSHQGTIVRERVNCLRGSKSKLTGSVVRLKILPHPLGVSHWVLKSPGCFIAWHRRRGTGRETPTSSVGHAFMHIKLHQQLLLPEVRVRAGSLACWTTFRAHKRGGGGMWVGMEAATEGVVKTEGVWESWKAWCSDERGINPVSCLGLHLCFLYLHRCHLFW